MELLEAIKARRSVRNYAQKPVDEAVIERLIDAAINAPSAVNAQPWLFTVIRDKALLDRISQSAKKHLIEAIDTGKASLLFRPHLIDPAFHIFYHAPVLILISAAREDAWAHEDAALAAENLMLAACAEGLGTCWIGFAQRWLETEDGQRAVQVPSAYRPIAPIIVGHPSAATAPTARHPARIQHIG